jgi:cytoskeletal protein CcmA (bactofilin family)
MIFNRRKEPIGRNGDTPEDYAQQPAVEPSFLAADTVIEGNIVSEGEIHIDGELRGNIQAGTCLVETNGVIQGSISAQYVVVRGRVLGPITAGQVSIAAGGHVEGNVLHQGLSIERGAYMSGNIAQGVPGEFGSTMVREPITALKAVELNEAEKKTG